MKDDLFIEKIKSLKPDIIIVVAFRMIPKKFGKYQILEL